MTHPKLSHPSHDHPNSLSLTHHMTHPNSLSHPSHDPP